MKTKNFPTSKNQRRKIALANLLKTKTKTFARARDISVLEDRIIDDVMARDIRSKIRREK